MGHLGSAIRTLWGDRQTIKAQQYVRIKLFEFLGALKSGQGVATQAGGAAVLDRKRNASFATLGTDQVGEFPRMSEDVIVWQYFWATSAVGPSATTAVFFGAPIWTLRILIALRP